MLHRQDDVQPARPTRFGAQTSDRFGGRNPVTRHQGPIPSLVSPSPRRRRGCYICGRFGCYSALHDDGFKSVGDDRGFPRLPGSPATTDRRGPSQEPEFGQQGSAELIVPDRPLTF